jgi:hypothetical protein
MVQARPHHQVVIIAQFAITEAPIELNRRISVLQLILAQPLVQFIEGYMLSFQHRPTPFATVNRIIADLGRFDKTNNAGKSYSCG